MSFQAQFSVKDLVKDLDVEIQKVESVIQNELVRVGLEFVRNARINADFTDRTGNLRSSIGFVLLKDGQNVFEDFERSGSGKNPEKGIPTAKQFMFEGLKGSEMNRGFVLAVVAGMDYAVFVESRGFDVITSSAMKADSNLKTAMESLKQLVQ